MKTLIFSLPLFAILALASPKAAANETETALIQLGSQVEIITNVKRFVERQDLGRLMVLANNANRVREAIQQNGLRHFETSRRYQALIIAHRYSEDFLTKITTRQTAGDIARIRNTTQLIIAAVGFDESPYTAITESVYKQIHKLFTSLLDLQIDEELAAALRNLIPDLGDTIALASQGDRPKTFAAGQLLYQKITALYPHFDRIAYADAAFDIVLNIQGLNEFYGEYAQVGRP